MKYKKNIVTFLLAASILMGLPGCKRNKESKPAPTEPIIKQELPKDDETIESSYEKYKKEIMAVSPNYKNLEYYLTSEEVEDLSNYNASLPDCPYTCPKLTDSIDKLVKQIRFNGSICFWDPLSSNKLDFPKDEEYLSDLGIDYFVKSALTDIFSNATNNIAEDLCALSDYKIALSTDVSSDDVLANCSYNTHTITLYYERIKVNARIMAASKAYDSDLSVDEIYKEELIKRINLTLIHEINHARQNRCKHTKENAINNTIVNYSTEGPSFICEASAESSLYNLELDEDSDSKTRYDYTYLEERAKEGLLLLINMTSDSIEPYYNAIYDGKLDDLYEFFNLETKEEIESFYRILYTLDTLSSRSKLSSISNDIWELKDKVGNEYLIDITKLALKNMINYTISHPDFTLEENVTLFDVLKAKISVAASTYDVEVGRDIYGEEFIENFNFLMETYESFLMNYYNVDHADALYSGMDLGLINATMINNETYESDELIKAYELIEKFPVFKAIAFSDYIIVDGYINGYFFDSMQELSRIR